MKGVSYGLRLAWICPRATPKRGISHFIHPTVLLWCYVYYEATNTNIAQKWSIYLATMQLSRSYLSSSFLQLANISEQICQSKYIRVNISEKIYQSKYTRANISANQHLSNKCSFQEYNELCWSPSPSALRMGCKKGFCWPDFSENGSPEGTSCSRRHLCQLSSNPIQISEKHRWANSVLKIIALFIFRCSSMSSRQCCSIFFIFVDVSTINIDILV